jgi:hypothetical protein
MRKKLICSWGPTQDLEDILATATSFMAVHVLKEFNRLLKAPRIRYWGKDENGRSKNNTYSTLKWDAPKTSCSETTPLQSSIPLQFQKNYCIFRSGAK